MVRFRSPAFWIAALVVAVAGIYVWRQSQTRPQPDNKRRSLATLNVDATSDGFAPSPPHYLGSTSCVNCHAEQHQSYLQTAHSRSMRVIDINDESEGEVIDHALSGRSYGVSHENGQLVHREWLGGSENSERLMLHEMAMRYVMGSGRFAKSYLASVDGFLIQSPLTWYQSKQHWGMSPGYDAQLHRSFQRAVTSGCLFCHSGDAEQVDGSPYRLRVSEVAIGCERCHGPGSTHIQRQKSAAARDVSKGEIVNPAHLPRELAEAVCQQCHLQGEAQIARQNKRIEDYRPGLPLSDYRTDFNLQKTGSSMTVVGHVEQLHMSACYQQSETLTCVTCHDPHHDGDPRERVAVYRVACLQCHAEEACTAPPDAREARESDNCSACHMPQSPTEVPHIAFTHHRIGFHGDTVADPTATKAGELAPFQDLASETEAAVARAYGLAHLAVFRRYGNSPEYQSHLSEAERLLQQAASNSGDAVVQAELATLAVDRRDWAHAETLSLLVLGSEHRPTEARLEALAALGQVRFQQHRFQDAVVIYRELTSNRYDARDWYFLGLCEQNCNLTAQAIQDLQQATRIDPSHLGTMDALAAILQSVGATQQAESLGQRSQYVRRRQAAKN